MKLATPLSAVISGILATFTLSLTPAAYADTIHVNAITDIGDWTDGNCELREAILAANTNSTFDQCVHDGSTDFDTIVFDASIGWPATITLNSQILITDSVQIAGPGASRLSVNGNFASRIFDVSAVSGISGLALWHGYMENPVDGGIAKGGAIHVSGNGVVIDGCWFFANTAKGGNGNTDGVTGGTAFGGAIYGADPTTEIYVKNSLFMNNFAEGGEGGTLFNGFGTIGSDGGGAFGSAIWSEGPITLINTTVTGNGSYGGDSGLGTLDVGDAGPATGAIDARGDLELRHVTISGNSAVPGSTGWFQLSYGGGVYHSGDGTIEYSIVAGNTATNDADIAHSTANLDSLGHNVLGVEGILFPAVGDVFGSSGSPVDPLLGPLADNGGQTWTMALLAGSPALDIDGAADCLENRDQRSIDRPQGSGCDAGAFELEVEEPAPFCPLPQGYWKNNPDLWPFPGMTLGNDDYDQAELLAILNNPSKKDASVILAKQLISAKLNLLAGANGTAIMDTLVAADGMMLGYVGKLPYNIKTNSAVGKQMTAYAKALESFNKQELNPECAL